MKRAAYGWVVAAALSLAGLLLLPNVLEHWLMGAGPPADSKPLTQSELDRSSVTAHLALDAALLRLGLDQGRMLHSKTTLEQQEGLVWESRWAEAYLPADLSLDDFRRELKALDLPTRVSVDIVQPDAWRIDVYTTIGKARIRHELFRVHLDIDVEAPAGVHPNIALVLLPGGQGPEAIATLDVPVTVGIRPFELNSQASAWAWTRAGHEVLSVLALDGTDESNWGGPEALRAGVDQLLDAVPDQVGALLLGDTRSARDPRRMDLLARDFAERRALLIDHWTHPGSLAVHLARRNGAQAASVDILLDSGAGEGLDEVLQRAAQIAIIQGHVVVAAELDETRLAALSTWVPEMRQRGLHFVFVHEALRNGPLAARSQLPL